jgi:hypothetical protein
MMRALCCQAGDQRLFFSPACMVPTLAPCLTCQNTINHFPGRYVVSPTTSQADNGSFRASVAISSGSGSASHHRVYRFSTPFSNPRAAQLFAVTLGSLHQGGPHFLKDFS